MKPRIANLLLLAGALMFGCADMTNIGSTTYGETSGSAAGQAGHTGRITALEAVKVDEDYKFGVGTVVGTVAESKIKKKDAQRVTVRMTSGGDVTILQPVDARLKNDMNVRIEGSGESARVVPR